MWCVQWPSAAVSYLLSGLQHWWRGSTAGSPGTVSGWKLTSSTSTIIIILPPSLLSPQSHCTAAVPPRCHPAQRATSQTLSQFQIWWTRLSFRTLGVFYCRIIGYVTKQRLHLDLMNWRQKILWVWNGSAVSRCFGPKQTYGLENIHPSIIWQPPSGPPPHHKGLSPWKRVLRILRPADANALFTPDTNTSLRWCGHKWTAGRMGQMRGGQGTFVFTHLREFVHLWSDQLRQMFMSWSGQRPFTCGTDLPPLVPCQELITAATHCESLSEVTESEQPAAVKLM